MGTRFLCTEEAPIHDNIKRAIVDVNTSGIPSSYSGLSTTPCACHATRSALKSFRSFAPAARFEDVRELVAGARGRTVYESGDVDAGIWTVGMAQGLIHDIPTVDVLMARIVQEATVEISRLAALSH
jgi:NAD(P)H-dependent flavin oxidoreductase YrpB (nitropropane dioxygenase family)